MKRFIPFLGYGLAGLFSWGSFTPTMAQSTVARVPQVPFNLSQSSLTPSGAASSPAPQCMANLSAAVDKIIAQPALRPAHWGIFVQPIQSDLPFYSKNADQFFLPASNAKLFTTAAALIALSRQFPKQTPIFATGQSPNLKTLRIVGQGDPSFRDRHLEQIALALKARGIQTVETLIGDDSLFKGRRLAPSWTWEDLQGGDGLPVNSLILNENTISAKLTPQTVGQPLRLDWLTSSLPSSFAKVQNVSQTVNSANLNPVEIDREEGQFLIQGQLRSGGVPETVDVPVPNPGQAFLEAFKATLSHHQIRVNRLLLTDSPSPQPGGVLAAAIPFPTLDALILEANQQSNNLYAETLLRLMGSNAASASQLSTPEQGLLSLKQTLTQLGIDSTSYSLVDGSGLSRKNLVSPKALVEILSKMARSPYRARFLSSLAVAGKSGTLDQRLGGTALSGNLYGKTGTLYGVSALSGFINPSSPSAFAFSILVNDSTQPNRVLRTAIDQIVLMLNQAHTCARM